MAPHMAENKTMTVKVSHFEQDEDDFACLHGMQYLGSALISMTLHAALELDIFGIIAKAGHGKQISAREIADHLPKKNSTTTTSTATAAPLDRMLRLLVTHSFLTSSVKSMEDSGEELVYGLAPVSKFFSLQPCDGSLTYMLALANHKSILSIWAHMKDFLLEGGDRFREQKGISMFEFMQSDVAFKTTYMNAMAGISALAMNKILQAYKGFDNLTSVVDVGGGSGKIVSMIVSKVPSIRGINYDLQHVIQAAPILPGVEHVAGDMFEWIPRADAVILKDVLHNWSDEQCLKMLKNCYDAIPEDGKVVIIAMMLPEIPDQSNASRYLATIDYIMMLQYTGRERSEKEFASLCKGSGFSKHQVAYSAYGAWSVIEFHK